MASDPKRMKIELGTEDKKMRLCYEYIYKLYTAMIEPYNTIENYETNLSLTESIGSVMYSIIKLMERTYNGSSYKIEDCDIVARRQVILKPGVEDEQKYTIEFKMKDEVPKAWSLVPKKITEGTLYFKKSFFEKLIDMMAVMTLYNMRLKEMQLGTGRYFEKKVQTKAYPISSIGLDESHQIFLEGITYPRSREPSVLSSMGALTLAHKLSKQNSKYKEKYEEQFINSISHIRDHLSIVKYFASNTSEYSVDVMRSLANLLLLAGQGHSHRIACPFGAIMSYYKATRADKGKKDNNYWDLTGLGAWAVVRHFQNQDWTVDWKGGEKYLRQAVFHAIMGTQYHSFDLLSKVTDCDEWFLRSEMIKSFKNRTSKYVVKLEPIKMTHASKMFTSVKIGLSPSGTNCCFEPFSGSYVRVYSEELMQFIENSLREPPVFGATPTELITSLVESKVLAQKKIDEKKKQYDQLITTKWKTLDNYISNEEGTVVLELKNSGRCFFSSVI